MTDGQAGAVCPQCGSVAAVHSIEELAALAKGRLGGQQPGFAAQPQPGFAAQPQPGFAEQPQPGFAEQPQPGFSGQPQPGYAAQPQPGPPGGPVPGYAAQPRPGPPGGWQGRGSRFGGDSSFDGGSIEDDIASAALGAAARFIGRKVGRRMQQAYEQKVQPALAAKQEATLRAQIAIAERHPDLRACLNDQVVFLAGGSRVLPMASVNGMLTLEQSDALVAQLRDG